MKKIYNAVASEYEMPQLTPEPRYLRCETITGEWWYKDMQTGENLPKYATPIEGLDTVTYNREKVFNEFVDNVIDPIEQCQKLQKEVDELKRENERLNNIINELEKDTIELMKSYKDVNAPRYDMCKHFIYKLNELKENI